VITLYYGMSRAASDIDVLPTLPGQQLAELVRLAGEGSTLHREHKVHIQPVKIVTYPEDYLPRLVRLRPRFALVRTRLCSSWKRMTWR
jgi:hypothetical protein